MACKLYLQLELDKENHSDHFFTFLYQKILEYNDMPHDQLVKIKNISAEDIKENG